MGVRGELFRRAKAMRREPTAAEQAMWRLLRLRFPGVKFRRQVPVGSYIADFACFYPRVIVECDGGQHVDSHYDDRRDAWLRSQGFRIFRCWNNEIIEEAEGVVAELAKALGV